MSVSNSGGQLAVQLSNFPLGTTYFFCHSGSGYPTGGTVTSNPPVNVTSPNQSFTACPGTGNFWIGLQGTDGHDYYSNQVTLAPAPPASVSVSPSGSQLAVQLSNFPLGTTYFFCHSGSGYPTGGTVTSNPPISVTSPNQSFTACSGTGNFWIGLQGTDGHDYYSNQVTLAPPPPSVSVSPSGNHLAVQLSNFPLGTTYFFCHSGSGYPTGGTVTSNPPVSVTSPNQSFTACTGSGNFWIGLQGTDGHDYYSNQVTIG